MQLKQLVIDDFGIWKNLELTLSSEEINVFYGPNEAGKTTVLRFIRGILYGFDLEDAELESLQKQPDQIWSGKLILEHEGEVFGLHREVNLQHPNGQLRIEAADPDSVQLWLSDLLEDVDRITFEQVFAVGLRDMQDLGSLNSSEMSDFLYNLTLDADAHSLIEANHDIRRRTNMLGDDHQANDRVFESFHKRQQLLDELDSLDNHDAQYRELETDRIGLDAEISGLRERREKIALELKGYDFLQRVWVPWHRVEQLNSQLTELPELEFVPEDAEAQAREIDEKLRVAQEQCHQLMRDAEQLKMDGDRLVIDEKIDRNAQAVCGLIGQQPLIQNLESQISESRTQYEATQSELDGCLQQLGPNWNSDQLKAVAPSAQLTSRMQATGLKYRSTYSRYRRLNSKWKSLHKTAHRKTSQLQGALTTYSESSVDTAIENVNRSLRELQQLATVRLKLEDLEKRKSHLEQEVQAIRFPDALPIWFHRVMAGFLGTGFLFVTAGAMNAVWSSGLVGLVFVMLGLTWMGIHSGLKRHYGRPEACEADQLGQELEETARALEQVRAEDADLQSRYNTYFVEDNQVSLDQRLRQAIDDCTRRRADLEELSLLETQLYQHRNRLLELKDLRKCARRDLTAARQNWHEVLAQAGLELNLSVSAALERWQQLIQASEKAVLLSAAHDRNTILGDLQVSVQASVDKIALDIGRPQLVGIEPLRAIEMWKCELDELAVKKAEKQKLHAQEQSLRSDLARQHELIDAVNRSKAALYELCQVDSRDEFEQVILMQMHRAEVTEAIEVARFELQETAESEPELAIVEEDLREFDREACSSAIETLSEKLHSLDHELQACHETLGRIHKGLEQLTNDRRPLELRFDLNQVEAELIDALEERCSLSLAEVCLAELQAAHEKSRQPETIRRASDYFERLTHGRFKEVWSPLGSKQLSVTDSQGLVREIGQLSGGTREQLFLAIRLSLISQLAELGIRLPVVFDDLLVNFDHHRSEKAVETLLEFCEEGHQLLFFTCHIHLAHMFENRGFEPVWLHGPHLKTEQRRAG